MAVVKYIIVNHVILSYYVSVWFDGKKGQGKMSDEIGVRREGEFA
jgi:hypothetical protein